MNIKKFAKYFLYFMLYSVIGWLYEVFLEVVVYRWGFSNRGVFFGPYCVIYGFGALMIIFAFGSLKKQRLAVGRINMTPLLVFIGITLLATAVELAGSYIMETLTGSWMWDYRRYAFNFQGRIALNPSLRFGIGGMAFLYLLQPAFEKLLSKLTDKQLFAVSIAVAALFLCDAVWTFVIMR